MSSEKRLIATFLQFIRDQFNLDRDKADAVETIEYIRKGVEFKGTNLWILIFAVFIASIGLNVNSTAVIIGAMLISPLMGPILGIGTGVAINDLELLKKAFRNLMTATLFSVATSTVYFVISPLSTAQSELLARTNPTVWDVLIAFFGGLAGIVAGSRKEKSNAIPGVAIATALMPPLCTAGFGLATGNMYYFLGAFYLYFINSVFITLATFLIVRFLRYPKKEFVDPARERIVKTWITFFVLITIIPSTYLTYRTVKHSMFEQNAMRFIQQELNFDNTRIINQTLTFKSDSNKIEVTLFGDIVPSDVIQNASRKLADYNLDNTELIVLQGYNPLTKDKEFASTFRSSIIEDLYHKNQLALRQKDDQIELLERELATMRKSKTLSVELAKEIKALFPMLTHFSINSNLLVQVDSLKQDTVFLVYMRFNRKPNQHEVNKLEDWLKARVNHNQVKVIIN